MCEGGTLGMRLSPGYLTVAFAQEFLVLPPSAGNGGEQLEGHCLVPLLGGPESYNLQHCQHPTYL